MPNLERRRPLSARAGSRSLGRTRRTLLLACPILVTAGTLLAGPVVATPGPAPAGAATSGATLQLAVASFPGDSVSSTPSEAVQAGSDVTYRVSVDNPTAVAQTNATVSVVPPTAFALDVPSLSTSLGAAVSSSGTITWSIANLAAGASATLHYTETADAPASLEPAVTSASAASDLSATVATSATVDVVPAADLSVMVSDGVDAVAPGSTGTYTVTVTDSGPSPAPDATVTESFNGAFAVAAAGSSDGGSAFTDLGGGQFEWTDINLSSGASATFTLVGTVPASLTAGSVFVDVTTVSPDATELATNPVSSATDADVVSGPASTGTLGVTIASYNGDAVTSSPSVVALAGTNVTSLVTVTNPTAITQTGVSVSVTLPPALTLASTVIASAGTATTSGGLVTWTVPGLAPGASVTLTYTETTDDPAAMASDSTSVSAGSDQSTAPTGVTAAIEVVPAAELTVDVTDGADTTMPGSSETYTITVTNHGPSPVNGAALTDTLSGGFTPLFAVSSIGGTTFSDVGPRQFEWAGIDLAGGASATFTLMGTASASLVAGEAFVDVATVSLPPGSIATGAAMTALDADSVVLAPQAISFTPPARGVVGQSATLSATGGGSGNPVVFSVDGASDPGVCAVSGSNGSTLEYLQAGTCVIDADQAGSAGYAAAPTATGTVVVDQLPAFTQDTPPTSVTVAQPYTYTFVAGGVPTPTYSLAAGAPTWLSIDAATGALSGSPPAGATSFSYSVVASNVVGSATAGPFTVAVAPATNSADADVSVALDCPATVPVDALATCTLTVANAGPSPARDVTAGLLLPYRFRLVSSTGGGWWFGHVGVWSASSLPAGGTSSYSVHFRTRRPGRGMVVAATFSGTPDPDRANNVVRSSVTVDG